MAFPPRACASLQTYTGGGVILVDCEKEDFGRRRDSAYFMRGLDAIHDRHFDIEENYFWLQFFDLLDGLFAIFGFATHG